MPVEARLEALTITGPTPRSSAWTAQKYNECCKWPRFEGDQWEDPINTTGPFPALKSGRVGTENVAIESRLFVLGEMQTLNELVEKGLGEQTDEIGDWNYHSEWDDEEEEDEGQNE
jgi:hypothetical protein